MTKEKLKLIAFERLEEIMQEDPEEGFKVLPICMGEGCKRLGILIKRRKYWMRRGENEELYDRAISHYDQIDKQGKGGLSHGYCPPCGEDFEREIDDFIMSSQ